MKKYILKLIDEDIAEQKKFLASAEEILTRFPNDQYWERRKKAQEKKISFAVKYREKILNLL
jgi:hypothetical protein